MSRSNLYSFLIVLSFNFISCEDSTYKGKIIQIDFHNVVGIENEDWIEIDDVRFTHYSNMKQANQNLYSLPASEFVYTDPSGKEYASPGGDISLAIQLGNYIRHFNQVDSLKTKNEIYVSHIPLMMTKGKLRLKSKKDKPFTVRSSKKYPAIISVLE